MQSIIDLETWRYDQLCSSIHEHYGLDETDLWGSKGFRTELEIFEVTAINGDTFSAKPEYNEEFVPELEKVRMHPDVFRYVNVGDIFLLGVVDLGDEWRVVSMSQPYETFTWDDEDELEQH